MRVERYSNYLSCMPSKRCHLFSCYRTPYFSRMIERASAYFVAKRNIEGHTINSVFMPFEGMNEVAGGCIPKLASTIITACEELISVFVETAIGEREYVAFEFFDKCELLLLFIFDFLYQLCLLFKRVLLMMPRISGLLD